MRVALISIDPSFGNCVGIYESLRLKHEVTCFFQQKDPKGFYKMLSCFFGLLGNVPNDFDHYFIVSFNAFMFTILTPPSKTTVVLTDSLYLEHHDLIDLDSYRVLCMPDLVPYCKRYDKLFYHPFEWHEPIMKNDVFTIAHSPYSESKMIQKGTDFILSVVPELDVITGLPWVESVRRKSKAHVFIDQLGDRYAGGLGKSGIEAMAVGCVTLTSGVNVKGDIPVPPVIRVNRDNLGKVVIAVREYSFLSDHYRDMQKQWVDEYLNYEYQSNYLL